MPDLSSAAMDAATVAFAKVYNDPSTLTACVRAAVEAAVPLIAAAERERWRAVLADHYLMGINCDPDTKRDNPMCGCSRIHLGWHPSIGEARQAWLDHVTSLLTEEPTD